MYYSNKTKTDGRKKRNGRKSRDILHPSAFYKKQFQLVKSSTNTNTIPCEISVSAYASNIKTGINALHSDINISQGMVETQFRCGGVLNDVFVANF